MKKYIFCIWILLTLICSVQAQHKKPTFKFNSINSIGLLSGEMQNKFTFQTINGLQYKSLFAGVGAAFDNYGYHSIPVFMDLRKTFGHSHWQPFVYVDGGINLPLLSNDLENNWANTYKIQNTFYGEAGFGVNRKLNRILQFNFSMGYSYKHFSYIQYTTDYYNMYFQPSSNSTQYDFYYRRISIKTGLQFQF